MKLVVHTPTFLSTELFSPVRQISVCAALSGYGLYYVQDLKLVFAELHNVLVNPL